MKHTLCKWGCALGQAVCAPQVHHEIHYECGLYKHKDDPRPVSSLSIDHQGGMPLVKLLAIIGALAAGMYAIHGLMCAIRALCCRKSH